MGLRDHAASANTTGADNGVTLMARTIRGLEWVAVAEIEATLGAAATAISHREVWFKHTDLEPALLGLGTVDDVFLVVCEFSGVGRRRESLALIRERVGYCDASRVLPAMRGLRRIPVRPSFDVTATFLGKRNFNRFEIEDATGAALASTQGWAYQPRTRDQRPPPTDLSVRVHLSGERATVGVRLAATPLHRRDYRQASRTASLRPPLARAVAVLAGLRPRVSLIDPFCGAGTIPIEAALASPGIVAAGFDIDGAVVELARQNAQRAGVRVRFGAADAAAQRAAADGFDRIATNPPWGQVVRRTGPLGEAWRALRRRLARGGGRVAVLGPEEIIGAAPRALGLELALEMPVSLLGQHVALAVLSPSGSLTEPGQLFERELDAAFARYGGAVLA